MLVRYDKLIMTWNFNQLGRTAPGNAEALQRGHSASLVVRCVWPWCISATAHVTIDSCEATQGKVQYKVIKRAACPLVR